MLFFEQRARKSSANPLALARLLIDFFRIASRVAPSSSALHIQCVLACLLTLARLRATHKVVHYAFLRMSRAQGGAVHTRMCSLACSDCCLAAHRVVLRFLRLRLLACLLACLLAYLCSLSSSTQAGALSPACLLTNSTQGSAMHPCLCFCLLAPCFRAARTALHCTTPTCCS